MHLKVSEYLELDELTLSIDEYKISADDVMDFEIHWQLHELYTVGTIKFIDRLRMLEHKPLTINDILSVKWIDAQKEIFQSDFIITDIEELRTDKEEVVGSLRFIDLNSMEYMRAFVSKGYTHADLVKISSEMLNKYKKDSKSVKIEAGKKEWGNEEKPGQMTHIIPGNISLLQNLYKYMSEGDFLMFQDRKNINITEWSKVTSRGALQYPLRFTPDNQYYIGKIGDYTYRMNGGLSSNVVVPDSNTTKIRISSEKNIKKDELNFTSAIGESGSLGSRMIPYFIGNGTSKIDIKTYPSQASKYSYKKYVNSMVQVEVIVPGWTKRNVGDKVELMLETQDIYTKATGFDKNMSGMWTIDTLIDKIVQGVYTQKMILVRAKQK